MSSAADLPSQMEDDSRSRETKPVKEKKRRRRSKQRDSIEAQLAEAELPLEDDGNNSNSSTPVYERSEDAVYPVGGSICALCYCGEKSLLGQGDITRYSPSPGFNPFKKPPLRARGSRDILYGSSPGSTGSQESFLAVEKVTKTAAQRRGSKQMREMMKAAPKQVEYVDELSNVGSSEILDVGLVFEATGHVTAHHCCAAWSEGVTQNESYNLLCVDKAVHIGMSQRCHSCSRYGATIKCRSPKCERLFHYPCAAGSGCFQDIKSMSLLCTDHLEMASTIADPDELNCAVCDSPGQISDLLFCTSCGHHYHGDCLYPHVDVNPVVRAGWQCPECKICQTCRQPGDDNKMLVCDVCDKGYHTFCLRPAMSFIPKNGWCCKNCRRCTDCGSRTPGNGPSSRWHINYQVCDKCYQLRNKGHACPVCSKAYRASPAARAEMGLCTSCKKYVHWGCEDATYLDACQKSADGYNCPTCRNQADLPVSNVAESEFTEPSMEQFTGETATQPSGIAYQSLPHPMVTDAEEAKVAEKILEAPVKSEAMTPPPTQVTPCSATRKRASTSSSLGSEKGNFALKGSSLDPMLYVGDDSIDQSTFTRSSDFASPPSKIRHVSTEEATVSKEKLVNQSSSDHNLGHLFTDENAQDAMSLFGVDSLPPSTARPTLTAPPDVMSGAVEAKMFTPVDVVVTEQSKMSMSPIGSPSHYVSPISKPPGPGIGKPGAMFGRGKPFGHKKKPAAARSRGKGKGKGHKRGGFSGARRRPRGGKGNAASPSERTTPRRARRSFHKQPSTSPAVNEEGLSSPVTHTKAEPVTQSAPADDEYGDSMHNTVVLCSTEDTFTLMQDMCVVCGSFGKDAEGRLISCSQCGQCYHPYCVGLKLTKVVLRKGWRCLDCTVCEECGQVDDPAHLLLCDDCDISYHTHCLKPPLMHVPKGGWKCKWCVRCVHCNATSPGKNCEWQSNYTSCAPCASANQCPKCRRSYRDDEIIMHCDTCNRWIHATCESLFSEADIEKVLEMGYECYSCRPKDATPPHLVLAAQSDSQDQGNFYMGRTRGEVENVKEYHKDFTQLTITGLRHVQKLMQKYMGLLKKKPPQARGNRNRKPSEVQEKLDVPPVLPTLEISKPKQDFGQSINVADAVKALQEPSEVYGKLSGENICEQLPRCVIDNDTPKLTAKAMDNTVQQSEEMQCATVVSTEVPSLEAPDRAMAMESANSTPSIDFGTVSHEVDTPGPQQLALPDPTKAVLGVEQGGVKKRRKPYRPGIGGFMVRSRGRGGFFKPRSRRGLTQPIAKELTGSTKSDLVTSGTTSESTSTTAPQPAEPGTADAPGQAKITDPAADPVTSIVSPVTIKVPPTAKPRKKKRMKLIDQFPPYLQDAFFGKDVMAGAEAKSNPLDDLNDRSVPASISLEQDGASKDRIKKRIMEEFELRARAAVAAKSHRNASQPQEDDVIMMDRENEQELLGVLPDLPFKDDELLGMISSELKQGGGESHENILSPSSLEKMVGDGFDENDMAALFSDVLNHQNDGATKQSHMPVPDNVAKNVGPSGGQVHPKTEPIHQHDSRPQSASHTPMEIQPESVSVNQQQRQLAIQAELQQIEMKQQRSHAHRQRQHDGMQRQMSVNIPSTGYSISQHEQNIQQTHQNMNIEQPRSIPPSVGTSRQHSVPMMPQHPIDPSRPRSHQGAMSPALLGSSQHTLPMNQRGHQGHSPHPTPPPVMFSRQASVPLLPVMQNQSSVQPDTMGAHLMPTQMQGQGITNVMGQQAHPKGPVRAQSMIGTPTSIVDSSSMSPGLFQSSDMLHGPVPVSMKPTCVTMPGPIQPTASLHKSMVKNSSTNLLQPSSGFMMSMQNAPSEAYSTSQPVAVQTPTMSPVISHKRSSSVPIVSHAESGTSSNAPNSQMMQPVGTDPPSQTTDQSVIPPRLPNFTNEIFEPSPPPWPLGTELDGESQSVNQRNILKWEKDEPLGEQATISPVLYANVKYPELKKEFPDWNSRAKQISKLWRKATPDERAPFLSKAKDNRSLLKTSRTRRSDPSKTPTPPVPSEEAKPMLTTEGDNAELTPFESQINVTGSPSISASLPAMSTESLSSALPAASTIGDSKTVVTTMPGQASSVDSILPTSKLQNPIPNLQPKLEKVNSDTQAQGPSPFPQAGNSIMTPKVEDSPTKVPVAAGVTRSKSVGDVLSQNTSQPLEEDMKIRRLSVDSQVQQISSRDVDIKPQVSVPSSSTQIRPALHQTVSSQRNARRARLWEQSQSNPPPPYPSVSGATMQTVQGVMYPQIGTRGQVMTIGQTIGPRGTLLHATSPVLHNAGMMGYPFEQVPPQAIVSTHPLQQRPQFPAGVHPISGYRSQHIPGAYIELRHTNESDPAVRRQNILRMMAPQNSSSTESTPTVSQSQAKETTTVSTNALTEVKTEPKTPVIPAEVKTEDPFAGGVMPHDEHLDALLRSEEFKDLHFQGGEQGAAGMSSAMAAGNNGNAAVPGTNPPATEPPMSAVTPKNQVSEQRKSPVENPDKVTQEKQTTPLTEKQADQPNVPVSAKETDNSVASTSITDENAAKDSETSQDQHKDATLVKEQEDIDADKDNVANNEMDHSYSRSAELDSNDKLHKGVDDTTTDSVSVQKGPSPTEFLNREGSQPRGVGLTPPPESEVDFLPSIEEAKQDSASPLTVSNVITVVGSPSEKVSEEKNDSDSLPVEGRKLDVEKMDVDPKVANNEAVSFGEAKDTDMSVFSKSPTSPVAQNLSRFAKVPDPNPGGEDEMSGGNIEKDGDEAKVKTDEQPTSEKQGNLEINRDCNVEMRSVENEQNAELLPNKDLEIQSVIVTSESTPQGGNSQPVTDIHESVQKEDNAHSVPVQDVVMREVDQPDEEIQISPIAKMAVDEVADSVSSENVSAPPASEPDATVINTSTSETLQSETKIQSNAAFTNVTTLVGSKPIVQTVPTPTVAQTLTATVTEDSGQGNEVIQASKAVNAPHTQPPLVPTVPQSSATQQLAQTGLPIPHPPTSTATSAGMTEMSITPQHQAVVSQPVTTVPPSSLPLPPNVRKDDVQSATTQQKPRTLLIKEQPLILQELLDQEKREQEKARHEKLLQSQSMIPQVGAPQPGSISSAVYAVPGMEIEKVVPSESGIDTIKMEFLSRMNEAAKAGLVASPATKGAIMQPVAGPMHVHQQPWISGPITGAGIQQQGLPHSENETDVGKYGAWLIQQQNLFQMQIPKQEQLMQLKKTRKQSLMKKRNLCKKNGKEFSLNDAEELKLATKQYTEAQQGLEKLRNDQKQHAELMKEFNLTQRHSMEPMTGIVQQAHQVGTIMDTSTQQQSLIIQHPASASIQQQTAQQILVPQFQGHGMQQNISQRQIVMMQPRGQQQQLVIKSIPASTNVVGPMPSSIASSALDMQQSTQVVMATQQNQPQQALIGQFQKIPAIRTGSSGQMQHVRISQPQYQLDQMQILQQQQKMQQSQEQQAKSQFPAKDQAASTSSNTGGATAQTHNDLMQMQMQQLMALRMDHEKQMAAQQNPDKPKPKRKRKKKKTQAEKEGEEKLALATQQLQQTQYMGANQTLPQEWHQHHATGPAVMQVHPMMGSQQQPRYIAPQMPIPMQPPTPTSTPTIMGPPSQPHTPIQHAPAGLLTGASHVMTSVSGSHLMAGKQLTASMQFHSGVSVPASPTIMGVPASMPSQGSTPGVMPVQRASPMPIGHTGAPVPVGSSPTSLVKPSTAIDTSNFAKQRVATSSTLPQRRISAETTTVGSLLPTRRNPSAPSTLAHIQAQTSLSTAIQGAIQKDKAILGQAQTMKPVVATSTTPIPMNPGPSYQLPLSGRSTPRNQSPRHALANLDGLSESEIAIIMAHDPDLSDSINKVPSTPTSVLSTPPHPAAVVETEEKSDDTKFKRAKKGFVMDSKTLHTIDDSIEKVVRLSVEYDDRLEAAKLSGTSVTKSPWELDPKPTKFPPRRIPEHMMVNQDSVRCLLTHPQYPGMMQAMTPEMMAAAQMQKTIPMGMMAYGIKPPEMDVDGQKKKKQRRSSKEVGPDGKPAKRKKKKDKGLMQSPFPMGTLVEGAIQGVMARPPIQGGKPGVMPPVVPFPGGIVTTGQLPVGHISPGQPPAGDMSKAVSQWKPLPLLKMSEPAIRTSHHMCVPEGTGVTNCKNVLMGLLAEATYCNLPDYYELVLQLKRRLKPLEPIALPSSKPSTPAKISENPDASITEVITITTSSAMTVVQSSSSGFSSQAQKYGPLGLDPDGNSTLTARVHDGAQSQIKVPESFPTPPHHGIDEKDDVLKPGKIVDDVVLAPSSPEMDDEDDWEHSALASLRMDDFSLVLSTVDVKSEKIRDCPSPTIPLMRHPKINLPPGRRMLDDKDSVSVTVEFENTNLKNIEKSLTLLSRILGAPIYSFNVVEVPKSSKEIKESLTNDVKEEQPATAVPPASQSNQITNPQQDDGVAQVMQEQKRCCLFCKTVVKKNGIRMPKFNGSAYEEDEIFCNKDCFIKYEFQEKKVHSTTPKKKFKASQVYQRLTNKINMETLLEKYPEEDGLPSKNTRSSVESIYFPNGVQDVTKQGLPPAGRGRGRRRGDEVKITSKRWKGVKWKKWSTNVAIVKASPKPPVEVEALLAKYGSAMKPPPGTLDKRTCVFCGVKGDGDTNTVARLLNVDVDRWVHLNCALWSAEVYETQGGALINVDLAWRRSESVICCLCQKKGATIRCHRPRCVNTYHCQCAIDIKCAFFKDKTVLCPTHAPKPGLGLTTTSLGMHQSGDTLKSLAVFRKVYVQRPETKQIASIMQQGELTQGEKNFVLRVGALIFENVGQLATHQMADCHSSKAIYPLGYKATRLFWSQTNLRRRCRYECSILEVNGKPLFNMSFKAALPGKNKPDKVVTHSEIETKMENTNVNDVWMEILSPLEKLRSQHSVLKLFPAHITGEKLFGLTIPVVSRILESLPNIELCSEYKFRYGRTPLLEVPLAINPTGCARSEPHIKQYRKKPHTLISNLISEYYESSGIGDASSLYGKQFVHSKSSQYRKMKNEWRSNVYLARSRIQGLGLFAARDIEPGTMVIEYIGDIIRTEVSEKREKMYEVANRGVYMFRLDSDHIVDATVTGGPARYINHSCKPNCVAEVVNFEKEKKIMIVSNRHILKGEELSYDYKFDFEDEGRKIPCLCGASNCKKWMN